MENNPLAMILISIVAFVLIWAAFSVLSGHTRYEHGHWGLFVLGMMTGGLILVHWQGSDFPTMVLGMGVGAVVSALSLRWWFGRKDREKAEEERQKRTTFTSGRPGVRTNPSENPHSGQGPMGR